MVRPALILLLLALSLVLLPAPGVTQAGSPFQPCAVTQIGATGPNQVGDITTTFGIGLDPATCAPFASPNERPAQYNFDRLVTFTPPEWYVAADADISNGAVVGSVSSKIVLGLLDNGCQPVASVPFILFEATTDRSDKIAPTQGVNRLWVMRDSDADGVPEAAAKWPTYLDDYLDQPGFDLTSLRARYAGVNTFSVTGTTFVINMLVFEPGTTLFGIPFDARLGYPTLFVLQDPTSPGSFFDPVSDFCAPIWTQTTLMGEVNSMKFRGSPSGGDYLFTTYAVPRADQDEDGIENQLDVCATNPNLIGWDPRGPKLQNPGDMDQDGVPDDCDPQPTVPSVCNAKTGISNSDEDCDGWQNRGDNCPLVSNVSQADGELDGIGDVCDPNPDIGHQAAPAACQVNTVVIGAGGPPPADPLTMLPCAPFDPAPTGDLDCDLDVDSEDVIALLLDWADIESTPCSGGYPWTCDGFAANILVLMRHVVEPHPWFIGCS